MEIIRMFTERIIIFIFLTNTLLSCQGQIKKENQKNIKVLSELTETNCFIEQKLLNKTENDKFIYKYDDVTYEIRNNKQSTFDLLINGKKYLADLILESAKLNFHYYKCNNEKIFLIEGDDYYNSVFFTYYIINNRLYYLGNFNIDQPNVESTGILKKNFAISLNADEISIQVLIDNSAKNKVIFRDKREIKCLEEKILKKTNFSIVGRWQLDCEEPQYINIKENQASFVVISNQLAINMIKLKQSTDNLYYYKLDKKPLDMGRGGASLNWNTYLNNKEIVKIKILNETQIEFNWLGFYNEKTKKRELTKCDFTTNNNKIVLTKCK